MAVQPVLAGFGAFDPAFAGRAIPGRFGRSGWFPSTCGSGNSRPSDVHVQSTLSPYHAGCPSRPGRVLSWSLTSDAVLAVVLLDPVSGSMICHCGLF